MAASAESDSVSVLCLVEWHRVGRRSFCFNNGQNGSHFLLNEILTGLGQC